MTQQVRLGKLYIVREQAGVLAPVPVWLITHRCWWYGPHEQLWRCVWDMLTQWKHDRNIVG